MTEQLVNGFIQECNRQGLSNTQAAALLELSMEKKASRLLRSMLRFKPVRQGLRLWSRTAPIRNNYRRVGFNNTAVRREFDELNRDQHDEPMQGPAIAQAAAAASQGATMPGVASNGSQSILRPLSPLFKKRNEPSPFDELIKKTRRPFLYTNPKYTRL